MPKYKVLKTGNMFSRSYHPEGLGKRNFVYTDAPLKPIPSWLEAVEEETATEKKKRLADEKKAAKANAKKAKDDQSEIEDVTFIAGEEKSTSVETL